MFKPLHYIYYTNILIHLLSAVTFYYFFNQSGNNLFLFLLLNTILLLNINECTVNKYLINNNLFNHFIFVISFFILYKYTSNIIPLYCLQIFIYTFIFFIFKLTKFSKSINTWTYTHLFIIHTSFSNISINEKILLLCLNFLVLQMIFVIINLINRIFINYKVSEDEIILNIKVLKCIEWFNIKSINTQLALRGALISTFLFVAGFFLSNNDIRPTWSMIIAVSCLPVDDVLECDQLIKNISVATILSLLFSYIIIHIYFINKDIELFLSLTALVFSFYYLYVFEQYKEHKYLIINNSLIIVSLVLFLSVVMIKFNEIFNLRLMSNLLGIVTSITVLEMWKYVKKYNKKN